MIEGRMDHISLYSVALYFSKVDMASLLCMCLSIGLTCECSAAHQTSKGEPGNVSVLTSLHTNIIIYVHTVYRLNIFGGRKFCRLNFLDEILSRTEDHNSSIY